MRVSGIAKGVGMIHPRMATMLSIVLTDATVEPATLWGLLRPAAARTWDQLSVDGDTSTNDTVFVLASGAAGTAVVRARDAGRGDARRRPSKRSHATSPDSRPPTARVPRRSSRRPSRGARDDAEARAVARAVISSSLVKAAAHGRDPNWGRIAGAAGNGRLADAAVLEAAGLPSDEAIARAGTPARLDPARLRISIAGHLVFDGAHGRPTRLRSRRPRGPRWAPRRSSSTWTSASATGTGEAFGCDLTEAYVIENSEYTT